MARLESEAKGGYYPTPPEEMELILKRVRTQEGTTISLLDPCCGKGFAIRQMKDHLLKFDATVTTYGIELEKTRAEEAKKYVDHVLACGYEDARMSHDAFSCMYLNPPFMDIGNERAELRFFRDLTQVDSYLPVGSLIIFNLPQYVLGDVARLISVRMEKVRVYRFTDKNYPNYKQVIVFGYRKAPGTGKNEQIEKYLQFVSRSSMDAIPSLDTADWNDIQYIIPAQIKPVEVFQSTLIEIDDVIKSMENSKFYTKVLTKIMDVNSLKGNIKSPAMPLKITHFATAIAAGALPEHMGNHLLVGVTKKVQEETNEIDIDTGKRVNRVTYKPKSMVRVFSKEGIFNLK